MISTNNNTFNKTIVPQGPNQIKRTRKFPILLKKMQKRWIKLKSFKVFNFIAVATGITIKEDTNKIPTTLIEILIVKAISMVKNICTLHINSSNSCPLLIKGYIK